MTILVSHQAVPPTVYNKIAPMVTGVTEIITTLSRTILSTKPLQKARACWLRKRHVPRVHDDM